jgi:hypothetical protein
MSISVYRLNAKCTKTFFFRLRGLNLRHAKWD